MSEQLPQAQLDIQRHNGEYRHNTVTDW